MLKASKCDIHIASCVLGAYKAALQHLGLLVTLHDSKHVFNSCYGAAPSISVEYSLLCAFDYNPFTGATLLTPISALALAVAKCEWPENWMI